MNTKINELTQQFADYTELYDKLQKELRAAEKEGDQNKINKYTARMEMVDHLMEAKSVAIQKAVNELFA